MSLITEAQVVLDLHGADRRIDRKRAWRHATQMLQRSQHVFALLPASLQN